MTDYDALDAGERREFLAAELAAGRGQDGVGGEQLDRWYARVEALGHLTGRTFEETLADLTNDAACA